MILLVKLRSFFATIYGLAATVVFGSIVIVSVVLLRTQVIANLMITAWGSSVLKVFSVRLKVLGRENIPKGGCVYVFNHSSDFDILALYAGVIPKARFGAKIELFSIPIFGGVLRKTNSLPIARGEKEKVFRLYDESVKRVHAGEQFILAAEGTRQPVPGVGEKFKAGPFIFAITGQFPIVPVVIRGAAECLAKGQLMACSDRWSHEIIIRILPQVTTKGLTIEERTELQDKIHSQMVNSYSELV